MYLYTRIRRLSLKTRAAVIVVALVLLSVTMTFFGRQTVETAVKEAREASRKELNFKVANVRPKTMLVLLAYMRSGSTFTGQIIQQSPAVFYVFEPLHSIDKLSKAKVDLIYLNSSDPNSYLARARKTLESFLTCRLRDVDIYTLGQYHMRNSRDTLAYNVCLKDNSGMYGLLKCLHLLENPCAESRVSAVKTIRYSMMNMTKLMKDNPEVKVLHLIRDPRPTLRSQMTVGEIVLEDLDLRAAQLCERVKIDLDDAVRLKKAFPGRVYTLRYEDLAERPVTVAEKLYSLLGLEFTTGIREFVTNLTSTSTKRCGVMCTMRNSTVSLTAWRQLMSYDIVSLIDGNCEDVYSYMGYLPLRSAKDLRNMRIPFYTSVPEKNGIYMFK